MATQLVLVPVLKHIRTPEPEPIARDRDPGEPPGNLVMKTGRAEGYVLRADPARGARLCRSARAGRHRVVARLKVMDATGGALRSGLVLVPLVPDLRVNGLRPGAVKVAAPGDVVACDEGAWVVAVRFVPEPVPVPPEVASRPCPVCGVALGEAEHGVQHVCGTWFHGERLDGDPASPDEFNCYGAQRTCPTCHGPIRTGETWFPDPVAWRFRHHEPARAAFPAERRRKEHGDERAA